MADFVSAEESRRVEVDPRLLESAVFETLDKLNIEGTETKTSFGLGFTGEAQVKFFDGTTYHGAFLRSQIHGFGTLSWNDGRKYEGEFKLNIAHGQGMIEWEDGSTYEGNFVDGLREGQGKFVSACKTVEYDGEWRMSKRHGHGVLQQHQTKGQYAAIYTGDFYEGLRQGHGRMVYSSGDIYEGEWYADKPHGFGRMEWFKFDERYIGHWCEGKREGQGQHAWLDVDTNAEEPLSPKSPTETQPRRIMCNHYEGAWVQDKRNGHGTFFYADGSRYTGEWKDDLKHGQGVYTFVDGRVYDGSFENDRMLGPEPMSETHSTKAFGSLGIELEIKDLIPGIGPKCRRVLREVENVLLRWNANLRNIYMTCSHLIEPESASNKPVAQDHVFAMRLWQFWTFCKVCHIPDEHLSLAQIDRVLRDVRFAHGDTYRGSGESPMKNIHDRYLPVLFREFVEALVRIAYTKFAPNESELGLAVLVARLMNMHVSNFDVALESDIKQATMDCCPKVYSAISDAYDNMGEDIEDQTNDHVVNIRSLIHCLKRAAIVAPSVKDCLKIQSFSIAEVVKTTVEPNAGAEEVENVDEKETGESNNLSTQSSSNTDEKSYSGKGKSPAHEDEHDGGEDREEKESPEPSPLPKPLPLILTIQEALTLALAMPVDMKKIVSNFEKNMSAVEKAEQAKNNNEEEKSEESSKGSARSQASTKKGAPPAKHNKDSKDGKDVKNAKNANSKDAKTDMKGQQSKHSARSVESETHVDPKPSESHEANNNIVLEEETDGAELLLDPAPPLRTTTEDMSRELLVCEWSQAVDRLTEVLYAKVLASKLVANIEQHEAELPRLKEHLRSGLLQALSHS